MHFHLPKPLHGWREFAGEVGIIVLGVLIALGFEQVVEDVHWRGEVREAKAALAAALMTLRRAILLLAIGIAIGLIIFHRS